MRVGFCFLLLSQLKRVTLQQKKRAAGARPGETHSWSELLLMSSAKLLMLEIRMLDLMLPSLMTLPHQGRACGITTASILFLAKHDKKK